MQIRVGPTRIAAVWHSSHRYVSCDKLGKPERLVISASATISSEVNEMRARFVLLEYDRADTDISISKKNEAMSNQTWSRNFNFPFHNRKRAVNKMKKEMLFSVHREEGEHIKYARGEKIERACIRILKPFL